MFIINAGVFFNVTWKAISLMLDPKTKEKIKVMNKEKEYLPAIKELVKNRQIYLIIIFRSTI